MLISKNWLHEYVFLPETLDPSELSDALTVHTVEVEGFTKQDTYLQGVVVGKILSVEKHENADRLRVCMVDAGLGEPLQVVCGGSNVEEGMLIAFAPIGATVSWHGEEEVTLEETTIRGVKSFGMICASEEIGLGDMFPSEDEKGILDLSFTKAKVGTPVAKAVKANDVIFDIDNKSMTHRPDLWGHYGIAREIAAMYKKKLNDLPLGKELKAGKESLNASISHKDCANYQALTIDNVTVGPSPEWLVDRLRKVGVASINNIVDLTNYVMFDVGQPLHAFDADSLEYNGNGIHIHVREARTDESIVTLDGVLRPLRAGMMVIADDEKPVAIAGIMGGKNSEVTDSTTKILLEAATFDAIAIRKMSKELHLRTDASSRFEKSLDTNLTGIAIRRFFHLLQDVCPDAVITSEIVKETPAPTKEVTVVVAYDFIVQKIGVGIAKKEIVDVLERLGFTVKEKKDVFHVTVPTWRATKDIAIKEDIVEEVARMYGYHNIAPTLPMRAMVPQEKHPVERLAESARGFLAHIGYLEMMNYSFVSREGVAAMEIADVARLELDNPVAKDRPLLRRFLSTNMVESVEKNAHGATRFAGFEIGKVFYADEVGERAEANSDELLPKQETMLGMAFMEKGNDEPYYDASIAVRRLLGSFGAEVTFVPSEAVPFGHPGRTAEIFLEETSIGWITELHPRIAERVGFHNRVALVELSIDALAVAEVALSQSYTAISPFPGSSRDVSLLVEKNLLDEVVRSTIREHAPLVRDISLVDVYTGKGIPKGKKSVTYSLMYQSVEKTMTTEEVDAAHSTLVSELIRACNAQVR